MGAKWPAMTQPKGAKMDNDKSHAFLDPNKGGGPAAPVVRNFKSVPNASRGGPYQSGHKQYARTNIHGGRGGSGNPASRGGTPSVGRNFNSDIRNPNKGGGVQVEDNLDTVTNRGGFGVNAHGKGMTNTIAPGNVSQYPQSHPTPGPGNMGGKMATRIAGNFTNKTKGKRSTGTVGSYGDRAPVTSNT
jgi:hypothetical protein